MGKGGDFESIFSFTHRGMCELFDATAGRFDLGAINPITDAARRGVDGVGLVAPAQENRTALYAVFLEHARRYLALYYASDDAVGNDAELGAWMAALEAKLPHGLRAVMDERPTFDGLATLVATIVYFASVEHEIVGSGLWDYQLWNDTSPVRVYEDHRRVPLDVYQRLVNANFNLNVRRVMLLDDFSAMALDDRGADAFRTFRADLLKLQLTLNRTPPQPWRMEPKRLKANINA
jgi:arachidonate 15-lipoxygenase